MHLHNYNKKGKMKNNFCLLFIAYMLVYIYIYILQRNCRFNTCNWKNIFHFIIRTRLIIIIYIFEIVTFSFLNF
jgi:hypothetical protein